MKKLLLIALTWAGLWAVNSPVVLCYHRFADTVDSSYTVSNAKFESQMKWLKANGYTVVPLQTIVDGLTGKAKLPAKAVAITVDDGHISVYQNMLPIVQKYNLPVHLFIYPSAISNASYAMSWEQLNELKSKGFTYGSHGYWHPNFKREKKKLTPEEYDKFVKKQLEGSKSALEKKLGVTIDTLGWPFGIYDDELETYAKNAGYAMSFTIDGRRMTSAERIEAVPRYMITDGVNFEAIFR